MNQNTENIIENLKFDDKGLIPAIVIDYYTKEVLTLAYMNKESLNISHLLGILIIVLQLLIVLLM